MPTNSDQFNLYKNLFATIRIDWHWELFQINAWILIGIGHWLRGSFNTVDQRVTVCVKTLEVTSAYIFWVIHMILQFRQKICVQHGHNFNFDFLHLMTLCRPLWVLKRQNRENLHFLYPLPDNNTGFALWRSFLGSLCHIRFIMESPIEK